MRRLENNGDAVPARLVGGVIWKGQPTIFGCVRPPRDRMIPHLSETL
jgi:hypothetical protein